MTRVEVRDGDGTLLSATTLASSLVEGVEGEGSIPPDVEGTVSFVATADVDGDAVSVVYGATVEPEEVLRRYQPVRETSPFQIYEVGPLEVHDSTRAPEELDPRIEEGACVPELECWLSVWVGDQPATVRIAAVTGVRVETPRLGPMRGFVRFPLVVVGNEATMKVEAIASDGQVLASRQVRLPIVPGAITARASYDHERVRLQWEQLGGAAPILVDVYRTNLWSYASSVSPEDPVLPIDLPPGVWRLQLRADLFSTNTAGVAHVVIPSDDGVPALEMAARAVLADGERDGLDPLAMAIVDGKVPEAQAADAIRALFGPRNFGVVSLAGVASRVEADPRRGRRERLRWTAAAAIVAIGLVVSLAMRRLERSAQTAAPHALESFDDSEPAPASAPSLERWLWAFVLLVYALVASLALSKGWF